MTRYAIKKQEFVYNYLGESSIWMHTSNGEFVELNETATFVANLLEKQAHTEGMIADEICKEYDISFDICQKEVKTVIEELFKAGMVEVC